MALIVAVLPTMRSHILFRCKVTFFFLLAKFFVCDTLLFLYFSIILAKFS